METHSRKTLKILITYNFPIEFLTPLIQPFSLIITTAFSILSPIKLSTKIFVLMCLFAYHDLVKLVFIILHDLREVFFPITWASPFMHTAPPLAHLPLSH